jgi:hypothetical protein
MNRYDDTESRVIHFEEQTKLLAFHKKLIGKYPKNGIMCGIRGGDLLIP